MRYEVKIALKFLLFNKRQSIFLLMTISMGVAIQLFISSLIVSLQSNLIESVLGNSPHIILEDKNFRKNLLKEKNDTYNYGNFIKEKNKIENYKGIIKNLEENFNFKGIVPLVEGNALYKKDEKSRSINILGLNLLNGDEIFNISNRVYMGRSYLYSNNIIIGKGIKEEFSLNIGDYFKLILPNGNIEKMRIVAVVDLENKQRNDSFVFIDLKKSQKILDKIGYVTAINLQLIDVFKSDEISILLEKNYKNLKSTSWTKNNKSLLLALKSQTSSSIIIQVVVMIATCLSITSVLLITVIQKSKEIGILKAMGALDKSISYIFIIQGAIFGFFGSIMGNFIGFLIIKSYMIGVKPPFIIEIDLKKVFIIIGITVLVGVISAYAPSRRCKKMEPIEVISGK
ncbi:FtsX-like permease family protein [uncultured Cetobacterium sp.]|uniref:ABC transporter permease n=1 Tax=uncultured Cetobacterium sp. TaxID=527638 RepID=UPI002628601E|nr:FtsX-like permease family protein [uncultured Cetobacterium sp.]